MEFKQVAETGTLKQIGKQQQSSLRIGSLTPQMSTNAL